MIDGFRSSFAASFVSLFTSGGTLICCALPALLVSLGAGAAMAGLVGAIPQIVWLSEHKMPLFAVAGAMLVLAGALQWHARSLPCPSAPALAAACARTRRVSLAIYAVSVVMFLIGAGFAFAVPWLQA
ncbi:MAG: hypothetical protein JNK75_11790 [Betaproteobacteria bacterium]|nr:hypothetical protein [Betaproteobacteria bacterium]